MFRFEEVAARSVEFQKEIKRFPELDGLRGIMAWIVVGSHLVAQSGFAHSKFPFPLNLFVSGGLAVDVFIILSGFVIFHLLDRKREAYSSFIFRRFFRLFPAYLVCLMFGAMLVPHATEIIEKLPWSDQKVFGPISSTWDSSNEFFWQHLLLHLTMLHGLLPNEILPYSSGAILDVAWSISLEWQFYLIAPFLFSFMQLNWNRTAMVSCAAIAAYAMSPLFGGFFNEGIFATWHLHGALFLKFHYFFVGIITQQLFNQFQQSDAKLGPGKALSILAVVFIFVQDNAIVVWLFTMAAILVSPNAGIASKPFSWLKSLLNLSAIQSLGKISYSTYLVHISIIYFVSYVLLSFDESWSRLAFGVSLTLLTIPAVLVASWALYYLVELPFIRFSSNALSRRSDLGIRLR